MSELFTITDKSYKVLQCNEGHFLTTFVEGEDDIKEFNAYPKLYVNDDFDLVTWDFVSNPSVPGAFHKQVSLNEGLQPQVDRFATVNSILDGILRK